MAYDDSELFTPRQVRLFKSKCRKLRVKADLVDDCLQQLAMKILQSNNPKDTLKPKAIDNHIKSLLWKEMRYRSYLVHLRDGFQEAIVYPLSLQIDVRSLLATMPHPQRQICKLLAAGLSHKQISKKLKISPRTIGRQITAIKKQLIKCL